MMDESDEMLKNNEEKDENRHENDTWEEYFHLQFIRYFPPDDRPWFCPVDYTYEDHKGILRSYTLDSTASRIFVTLETSDSCKLASYIYQFVMAVIILNIVANVLMTLPYYRNVPVASCASPACDNDATLCPGETICEPAVEPYLNTIDDWCVITFTVEYVLRVLTVCNVANRLAGLIPRGFDEEERIYSEMENRGLRDPPQMSWYRTLYAYCTTARNIIDFVAILPFYITLIDPGNSASLSFIRILRLFRVLRAFNGGANTGVINMVGKTVKSSMEIIIFVLMIMTLFVFIYGSIIFSLESGTYIVNTEYPDGAYLLKDTEGDYFRSSVTDTFTGMYWAVVTMTTVGYGDIVPHTDIGKLVAVTCAFVGILFMALPIAILGSKVTLEYAKLEGKSKVEKEQRRLAIVERRLSKTGNKNVSEKLQKVRENKMNAIAARNAENIRAAQKMPPNPSVTESINMKEIELGGSDMDDNPSVMSAKQAMRNISKEKGNALPLADQRKLAEVVGEVEAKKEIEAEQGIVTGGRGTYGMFGKRSNSTTDAMELIITRLVDELTDEDSSGDKTKSLDELTRHLRGLSEAVKADLEADYRRVMLLVESADVLLHAAASK